jgi:two-component system cell cycle response regulator
MMDAKAQILVVDDENTVRSVLKQVLEEAGYDVAEAANGEQALAAMQQRAFDLVITDIKMPGITGLELLQKTKEMHPNTQVIIITSYASLDTSLEALRNGAYDYLFKPFEDLDLITAAANRAVEKILLMKENRRLVEALKEKNTQLEQANRILKNLACRDGLTGLYNHRYFQDHLTHELYRCQRHDDVFSLIFLDVDHFKKYNDTHGHLAGDKLLRQLAEIFHKAFRRSDVVARYGGEEFVIILPKTPKPNAVKAGEKIRQYVESFPFEGQETQPGGKLTISVGISSYPEDGRDRTLLIGSADEAMYRAKNGGRNRVCVAGVKRALEN